MICWFLLFSTSDPIVIVTNLFKTAFLFLHKYVQTGYGLRRNFTHRIFLSPNEQFTYI